MVITKPSPIRQRNKICFTRREFEVARLVVAGLKNLNIAHALQIEETTVQTHLTNAMEKVGAQNRSSLALKMLLDGVISMTELRELSEIAHKYGTLSQ